MIPNLPVLPWTSALPLPPQHPLPSAPLLSIICPLLPRPSSAPSALPSPGPQDLVIPSFKSPFHVQKSSFYGAVQQVSLAAQWRGWRKIVPSEWCGADGVRPDMSLRNERARILRRVSSAYVQ